MTLFEKYLSVLLLTAGLAAHAPVHASEATVLWADGAVQADTPGSTQASAVSEGTLLPEGSRLETPPEGSCALVFSDGMSDSAVMLGPDSVARLEALSNTTRVTLDRGELFVKLARLRKERKFEVSTPAAVATARGTGWRQTENTLDVFEGSVALKTGSGSETELEPSEGVDIGPDGSLSAVRAAEPARQAVWQEMTARASASPYFGRIRAEDVRGVQEAIDEKLQSAGCGAAGPYPWQETVEKGSVISSAQFVEIRLALSRAPFKQEADYVSKYLEPLSVFEPGKRVSASDLALLMDAAENTSC